MKTETTTVLAEHMPRVRDTLANLLRGDLGIDVVETADQPSTLLALTRTVRPALVIIDYDLPGADYIETARVLRRTSPPTRIVLLAKHFTDLNLERAMQSGVQGYASKADGIDEIRRVVEEVLAGRMAFSRAVRTRLAERRRPDVAEAISGKHLDNLTVRETQVLRHVAQGWSAKEIATALRSSPRTIERHTANLMAKLDIHDRVRLARLAIREGLIPIGDEEDGP